MKSKRQSTVEPVFGSLTQFFGMRKVNIRGIKQANKVMLMSASAYNLKKYLKHFPQKQKTGVKVAKATLHYLLLKIEGKMNGYKLLTI
jgi:hypothetical protein